MSYDFSFDKKSVILIVIGCAAIGLLLFFAGFIVGLDKGQSHPLAQATSLAPAQPEASSTAKDPAATAPGKPSAAKQEKPAPEPSKEPAAAAAAENKSSSPQQDAKTPAPKSGDAKDDKNKDDTKDKAEFSLQLGAFQTEDNALKLRDQLKSKGYPVFLFRVLDPNGHLWHTVRMGHYGDMKEASQAAAKMTGKEEISAWVRPSNAF